MHPHKSFDVTLAATHCVVFWHSIVLVYEVLYRVNYFSLLQLNELRHSSIVQHQIALLVCNI